MSQISDTTENAILNLVFSATAWANYADNAAGTPQTNIHVGLATADPTDTGTMSTSEATYNGYARTNVARLAGWSTASGTSGSISPAANIDFPVSTAGGSTNTITHFTTGKTGGGALAVLWYGAVSPSIVTGTGGGVTARLTTATTITLA